MALTMLVGGARSGKSTLAVEIGMRHPGAVTFVATAPAGAQAADLPDGDMLERIERHRAERPIDWTTIEETTDLVGVFRGLSGLVIVDCLTLWTSNLMWAGLGDDAICELASATAAVAAERSDPMVVISNEVGLGVHPDTELGRRYRDVHGWVNQRWAAAASITLLLVAGRAVRLDDPWTHLPST